MPEAAANEPRIIRENDPDPEYIWRVLADLLTQYRGGGEVEYTVGYKDRDEKMVK